MNFSNIISKFKILLRANYSYNKIKKFKFVIYDDVNSEIFKEFFKDSEIFKLNTRFKKINLRVFIKCLIKYKFKFTFNSYLNEYLKLLNPEYIFTFIDNNKNFWNLKNLNKNYKTWFIQNGFRDNFYDIFSQLSKKDFKKFKVDKMFVMNKSYGNEYKKYINGSVVSIGSFFNNKVKIQTNVNNKSLLMISNWI